MNVGFIRWRRTEGWGIGWAPGSPCHLVIRLGRNRVTVHLPELRRRYCGAELHHGQFGGHPNACPTCGGAMVRTSNDNYVCGGNCPN